MIRSLTRLKAPNPLRTLLAVLAVAAATAVLAACGSSGSSSAGGSGSTSTSSPVATTAGSSLKTATIGGAAVLTDAQGFAVYSFAPDTMTKFRLQRRLRRRLATGEGAGHRRGGSHRQARHD